MTINSTDTNVYIVKTERSGEPPFMLWLNGALVGEIIGIEGMYLECYPGEIRYKVRRSDGKMREVPIRVDRLAIDYLLQ